MKTFLRRRYFGLPIFGIVSAIIFGGSALAAVIAYSAPWNSPVVNIVNIEKQLLVVSSSGWSNSSSAGIGSAENFNVELKNPNPASVAAYEGVLIQFTILKGGGNTVANSDITLQYSEGNVWHNIALSVSGGNLVGYYGLPSGLSVSSGYDTTTPFKITFNSLGSYQVALLAVPVTN